MPSPHGGFCNDQLGFIMSKARERWVFGGNRSGKTHTAMYDMDLFARGIHPVRSLKARPPVRIRYCGNSWTDAVLGVLQPKLHTLIRRDQLLGGSFERAYSATTRTLWYNDGRKPGNKGSSVNWKSFEQDVNKFGGADLDAVYADEAGSRAHYRENMMRLIDRDGFYGHSMTPEYGVITWERRHVLKPLGLDGGRDHWQFTTFGNPFLSVEGLKEIAAGITDETIRLVKLYGKFAPLSGLVYPQYNETIHYITFRNEIPESWPRCFIIDPHIKKEHALMWIALDPEGRIWVYRTAKMKATPEQLKTYIRITSMGENIVAWIGDEAMGGDKIDNFGNESILKLLAKGENKIPIVGTNQASDKRFKGGVMLVREMFTVDTTSNTPSIFISKPDCVELTDELEEYQFMPENKTDELTFRERVRHINDDLVTCLRYGCQWAKLRGQGKRTFVSKKKENWR